MRILGIDPGDRRIGLALSDELGLIARGLRTFDTARDGDFFAHIGRLIETHDCEEIVVGNPIHLSGRVGDSGEKAKQLAEELQRRFGLKVTLWDERLSSAEANRVLRGSRAPKSAVDKVSAVIILQSYLDYRERAQGADREDGGPEPA
jgi:putative Holliday junction resolvase